MFHFLYEPEVLCLTEAHNMKIVFEDELLMISDQWGNLWSFLFTRERI